MTLEMVTTAVLCYRGAEAYSAMPKGILARGNLPLFDRHTQCLVAHIGMTDVHAYKLLWDNLSRSSCMHQLDRVNSGGWQFRFRGC